MIRFLFIFLFCAFSYGQVVNNPFVVFPTASCTDIYAEGDAADPCNETNTVSSNWAVFDGSNTITSVNESDGDGGTYSIQVSSSGNFQGATITLPALTNGATYTFEDRAKTAGSNCYIYILAGVTVPGVVGAHTTSSYTNQSVTGKIGNGVALELRFATDDASTTQIDLAWIKITKTADP